MTNPTVHSLNWVDYFILGIIAFSIIISFFRGFLREAVSLVVWLVGILVALKFANFVSDLIKTWIASSTLRYIVAFVALFLIIFIIGMFINIILHAFVKRTGLGVTDRMLGVAFGAARGLLIVTVLLMFASVGKIEGGVYFTQSRLAPKFKPMVSWLSGFLPQQMGRFSQWVESKNNEAK